MHPKFVAAPIGAACLALAALSPQQAAASPRTYDIQQLLQQDLPAWRRGGVAPSRAAPARTAPTPVAPPAVRAPAYSAPPPPAAPPPAPALRRLPQPVVNDQPPPRLRTPSAPPAISTPAPISSPATAGGVRVIQAPGAPRSTVSGAWKGGQ